MNAPSIRKIAVGFWLLYCCCILPACLPDTSKIQDGRGKVYTLSHDGLKRTYIVYAPELSSLESGETSLRPLVVALHGGFGLGENMRKLSAGTFDRLAETEGFVVAYPDGIERHWNDGRSKVSYRSHKQNIDDVGFLSAMIDAVVKEFSCDPKRIYVTGMSNGAIMSFRLGVQLSHKIAAIAPVAGGMAPEHLSLPPVGACTAPVPVLIIQNTDDTAVPIDGGEIGTARKKLGKVLSLNEAIQFWRTYNGCTKLPVQQNLPDTVDDDGTYTVCSQYKGGKAPVVVLKVVGGGHTWPGGYQYLNEYLIGKTSRDFDAAVLIWEFFKRQKRP